MDIQLKVLNPTNKKEFKMFTLRNIALDETDSPEKLKKIIIDQCGGSVAEQMDMGYFNKHSKKMWLNNRLDMSDLWDLVHKGDNITLWCAMSSRKRIQHDVGTNDTEDISSEKSTKKPKKAIKNGRKED